MNIDINSPEAREHISRVRKLQNEAIRTLHKRFEEGTIPSEVLIFHTSLFKKAVAGAFFFSLILGILGAVFCLAEPTAWTQHLGNTYLNPLYLLLAGLLFGFLCAYNEYYVVDRGTVSWRQHFGSKEREQIVLNPSEIHSVAIDPKRRSNRYGQSWWEYNTVLITKRGKILTLLEGEESTDLLFEDTYARALALALNTNYHRCSAQTYLKVETKNGKVDVSYSSTLLTRVLDFRLF